MRSSSEPLRRLSCAHKPLSPNANKSVPGLPTLSSSSWRPRAYVAVDRRYGADDARQWTHDPGLSGLIIKEQL
jgi:hypothetical protein